MAAGVPIAARGRRSALLQRARQFVAALTQPQVSSAARERRDLLVLLAALAFVVAPHFEHLAWWAGSILALLWLWRVWLAVVQKPLPGRFAMLPLLIAAAGAVWLEHRTLVGRDAGVTFLLMLLALKLLEMRAKRDVFVVIFLAFFILLTQFLFGQGLPIALMTLAAVVLLFFVLVSVNLAESDLPAQRKFRLVGLVLLKAVPLTAALFVLFPRLSGPLWGLPGESMSARTGLSNTMTPGSIGRLLESEAIAFRALFTGAPPLNDHLYWRGPVLGQFNGRTWAPRAPDATAQPAVPLELQAVGDGVDYTVTLEPHQRDWLFALEMPASSPGANHLGPRVTGEGQLLSSRLINERVRYSLRSHIDYRLGLNESPLSLQDWLQLPPGYNPRTLAYALELRRTVPGAQASRAADPQLVLAVLQRFRREGYVYTLEPPPLGRHSVDEFLFDTRSGYCEHYASAFVTVMRALDIPARVITGYQGGEFNPIDGFLTVRQSDAHAWAEVWFAGQGWTRVDPTAAVAPDRVQRGTGGATGAADTIGGAPIGERAFSMLRALRFNWEALENGWNQWVLSYSADRQRALLSNLGLVPDGHTLALAFGAVTSLILAILAVISLRHRVHRDPLGQLTQRLHDKLRDAGLSVAPHTGPRALQLQLESRLDDASFAGARELLGELEHWRYSRASPTMTPGQLRQLRARIRRYRPRMA